MTVRLWRPDGVPTDADLNLVVIVATEHLLYTILEGPPVEMRQPGPDWVPPDMLNVRVTSASGVELVSHAGASVAGGLGFQGLEPRAYVLRTVLPPDPQDLSEPFTVKLLREDWSIIWEVRAIPG